MHTCMDLCAVSLSLCKLTLQHLVEQLTLIIIDICDLLQEKGPLGISHQY